VGRQGRSARKLEFSVARLQKGTSYHFAIMVTFAAFGIWWSVAAAQPAAELKEALDALARETFASGTVRYRNQVTMFGSSNVFNMEVRQEPVDFNGCEIKVRGTSRMTGLGDTDSAQLTSIGLGQIDSTRSFIGTMSEHRKAHFPKMPPMEFSPEPFIVVLFAVEGRPVVTHQDLSPTRTPVPPSAFYSIMFSNMPSAQRWLEAAHRTIELCKRSLVR
jgi:hypothetical protein